MIQDYAESVLKKYEKRAKTWRWGRYVGLAVAILNLSVALCGWLYIKEKANLWFENRLYSPSTEYVTFIDLIAHTDHQITMASVPASWGIIITVKLFIWATVLSLILANWNRHKEDLVLAELVRSLTEENTKSERVGGSDG